MKRKFFGSLMLFAVIATTVSALFVACNDYDDDINDLRNQITTTSTDLQSLVTEKINNVNTEISSLQTQSANLQTAYEAADKQLQANIDALDAAVAVQLANASNNAEDYADAAAAAAQAAAEAYADVQAAEAQVAAIAAAQTLVDEAVAKLTVQLEAAIQDAADGLASLQGYVDASDASLSAQITAAVNAANDADADLQTQINAVNAAIDGVNSELATKANASDLTALTEKLEEYYQELIQADADLQKGIDAAQARADAAYDLAQTAQNLAETNADNIETLRTLIDKNQSDLSGQISDINGTISALDGAIATNASAIDILNEAVEGLKQADDGLQSQITVVGSTANEALTTANENSAAITSLGEQLMSLAESNEEAHAYIDASLASLDKSTSENAESIENLKLALTALLGLVEQNQKDIEDELAAGIAALESELATEVAALEGKIATEVATLEGEIAAEVAALNIAISNAVLEAEAYVDVEVAAVAEAVATVLQAAVEKLNGTIDDAVDALTISIGELEDAYKDADKALQKQIDELSEYLDEVAKDLQDGIDALSDALETNMQEIATALLDYATTDNVTTALQNLGTALSEKINETAIDMLTCILVTYGSAITYVDEAANTAETNLAATYNYLNAIIEVMQDQIAAIGDGNFDELWETVNQNASNIEALTGIVATINKYLGVEMKRLKSLVLAPTTYFNGIECIKFSTLSYTDWGENLYADAAPDDGTEITVSDDSHTEEYLVNPSNVTLASIASLSFVANTATDVRTRGVSDDAPIAVAASSIGENEEGVSVLTLNLKKTGTTSFGMDLENFTIVALKAVIADAYLTPDELEAGEEVAVYSDWARLCETSAVPYIHNAQAVDKNDKLDEEATDAHFYAFSDIYGEGGDVTTTVIAPEDIKAFIIEITEDEPYLDYRETLDLSKFSIICDKDGNTYDPEAYGFLFEYNVVPCLVGDATSSVDQSLYATIEDNVLTPTSADGETAFSTEAINKTPVIQVVLKDDNNGAVVDVRYFVIKIYDKDAQKDFGRLNIDTREYACGGETLVDGEVPSYPENSYGYIVEVSADSVAQLYAKYDMTEAVFFGTYTALTGLYDSQEEADKVLDLNGANAEADPNLGTIVLNDDHSLTWTIYYSDAILKATDEDYANGYMEVSAWAVFANATAENIVTFELTLMLEIDKLALADNANKNYTYWTTSGKRVFNPELETDEVYGSESYQTTMMIGNLLEGYLITGESSASIPASTLDLVNKGDEATFVFDQAKFKAEVSVATETAASDWTFSADGTSVYYKNVPAATITTDANGKCYVQLYEEVDGATAGKPGEPSEGAKLLVDIDLPIVLVDEWCELSDSVDAYYIAFLKPLEFSTPDTIEINLVDLQSGGSTSDTQLDNTIQLVESAAVNHRVVWDNYTPTQAVTGLAKWYGVESPVYDLDNALTDLQLDGKPGTECSVPLSSFTDEDGYSIYRLEYVKENNQIVFYNDSGNAISQSMHILVEVTIATKWQDEIVAYLLITVESGHVRNVRQQH